MKKKKIKVWKASTADDKFSKYIIGRDKKCARCGRVDRRLNCSHYWNRVYWITRYNADNCVALCAWCHTLSPDNWEADRYHDYEKYMIKRLGKKRFNELERLHLKYKSKYDCILEFMKFYENISNNPSEG